MVAELVLQIRGLSKKFCRSPSRAFRNSLLDLGARVIGRDQSPRLRQDEFWALRDVTLEARRGECIGVIGPNGAGKSTFLRIINGDIRPDAGQVERKGSLTPLIRLGGGLQPLLTGRENIYTKCHEFGFDKAETDALLHPISDFSGLGDALDVPVRQYSDGMYARLEFAIATAVPMDLLLIDEVLAVGDIAFQMKCLERLEQLKAAGTTILFVSHSEMNVRQIADRCLLLFEGECLGVGETDAMFRRYYESTGFLDRSLKPMGIAPKMPADFDPADILQGLYMANEMSLKPVSRGGALRFTFKGANVSSETLLVLQFWSASGIWLASAEVPIPSGSVSDLAVDVPYLGLGAGHYRVAAGLRSPTGWIAYRARLCDLSVREEGLDREQALFQLQAKLTSA